MLPAVELLPLSLHEGDTMRVSWESYGKSQGDVHHCSLERPWLGAVAISIVVGIAYFLTARIGVVLGVSQGVPIFWPAAGIAVGAFIALGPNAYVPVTVGVVAANFASGILVGRSLSLTITFAFFNTGEALLTAWLIERWFGRAFRLEAVRQVLGFVVASAVSEAIAASGAGIVVHFLDPTTSSTHAWRLWFASCSLGIFTVAPLIIGLGEIVRELPPRRELIEGTAGLATLAALSVLVISLPQTPWATALPVALVLPIILWIAVRCRPAFAAAAMFIVALAVIWSTTFEVGQFADASVPLADRILAAQTLVLAAALLALVLAALFAERRSSEAALRTSEERLADEAKALRQSKERYQGIYEHAATGIYIADPSGRFQQCNPAYAKMHGYTEGELRKLSIRDLIYPEDWARHTPEMQHLLSGNISSFKIENRCVAKNGDILWVRKHVSLLRDAAGRAENLVALVDDVTESKRAEDARRCLNAELDHRVKNALATVGAVVSHTSQGRHSVSDFVEALEGRLRSMASAHELLSARGWQGVPLTELVRRVLAPYRQGNNIKIDGRDVMLRAEAGQAIAMVFHELATNAAKYGALSTQQGRVSIRWDRPLNGHLPSLLVEWREIGGPPVVVPNRVGYGMSTIRDSIPYEFGGAVDLVFARDGVHCRLTLPARWLDDLKPELAARVSPQTGEREFAAGHRQ
jgi:PAS domain S-box-containing protein